MRKLKFLSIFLVVLIGLQCLSAHVFAKEVYIEWKATPGAILYQVSIEKNGVLISKPIVKETQWKGDLPTGIYTYKLRSVDRLKRAGLWSNQKLLVVLPPNPTVKAPVDGSTFKMYSEHAKVSLRWEGETEKYKIEVFHNGQMFQSTTVKGKQLDVPYRGAGEYSWKISQIFEADGRAPASVRGKQWQTPMQNAGRFNVERSELAKVSPTYPIGPVAPNDDGKIKFRWGSVDGAEVYEVRVYPAGALRTPAMEKRVRSFYSKDTSVDLKLPRDGRYVWDIRALANVDANRVPAAIGPKTSTYFELDPNASFSAGSGYVAFSLLLAPYEYKITSPKLQAEGAFNSTSITYRLSGEYWYHPHFGVSLAGEMSTIKVQGKSSNQMNLEAHWKYRKALSKDIYGWYFNPKIGFEYREIPELGFDSTTSNLTFLKLRNFGPSLGIDIRKLVSRSFSFGLKLAYYLPVWISEGSLSNDASYRNLSLGVQGLYWATSRVGLGLGTFVDRRSISYKPSGQTSSQIVYMDGVYFFGSVIINF
ncbi:MAG: hypothetical protein AB7F43_04685 [Bacteriovoracia bacterium]